LHTDEYFTNNIHTDKATQDNRDVLLHKNTIQGILQSFSPLVGVNIILCFWRWDKGQWILAMFWHRSTLSKKDF